jgi:hypothetical protein
MIKKGSARNLQLQKEMKQKQAPKLSVEMVEGSQVILKSPREYMFSFNNIRDRKSPMKVVSTHNMPLSKDLQHMNYTL